MEQVRGIIYNNYANQSKIQDIGYWWDSYFRVGGAPNQRPKTKSNEF